MDPHSLSAHIHSDTNCQFSFDAHEEVGMTSFSDSYVLTKLLTPGTPAVRLDAVVPPMLYTV